VDVRFGTDELQRAAEDRKLRTKLWGDMVAKAYTKRIQQLQAVRDLQELRQLRSLRVHALQGALRGKYGIDLAAQWRLIVTFSGEGLTVVTVEEVSNHYE
jgi:proteic killer suppression protein